MLTGLVEAAVALEMRMLASPLHKMHAYYLIGADEGDPTVATLLFRNRPHMEKARRLETAFAADLISLKSFDWKFPSVLYIAVNAHYEDDGFPVIETFTSEGVAVVRPGLEHRLTMITIELCKGAGFAYIPDDGKVRTDLVLGFEVSGRRGKALYDTGSYSAPFPIKPSSSPIEVFEAMERHIRRNGR